MVSRAVERKKLRREKKRHRDEDCVVPNVTKPPPKDEDDNVEEGAYSNNSYYGGYDNNSGYSYTNATETSSAPPKKAATASTTAPSSTRKSFSADDENEDTPVPANKKTAKVVVTNKKTPTVTENTPIEKEASDRVSEEDSAPAPKARRVEKKPVDNSEEAVPKVSAAPLPPSHIVTKLTNLERPLTRKERLKLETAQRNEKQLERQQRLGERLDAAEAEALQEFKAQQRLKKTAAKQTGDAEAEAGTDDEVAEEDNAIEAPKLPEIASRHDERFIGGTYWKERKERKRKTLFVGNLPMYYDQHTTKDYLVGILEAHGVVDGNQKDEVLEAKMLDFAAGKITEAGPAFNRKADKDGGFYGSHCPILSIDFLPTKANAKTRHAYVCFRTMEIAEQAQKLLDGAQPEAQNTNRLRVNFSDDKNQRDTAINKREGSKALRGGRGGGMRGRGSSRGGSSFSRGGSRGGGRGSSRGGGFSRGRGSDRGGGRGRTFGPGFGFGRGRGGAAPAAE